MKNENLVKKVFDSVADALETDYYSREDLERPNYSEICEWCGFPDLQNGGKYEQAIDAVCGLLLEELE